VSPTPVRRDWDIGRWEVTLFGGCPEHGQWNLTEETSAASYLDDLKAEVGHFLLVLWVVFEVLQLSLLGEIVDLRAPVSDRR
jgi:hypothetical protein